MASDYTPTNVTSGFNMEVTINTNLNDIKTAMDKTLNRSFNSDNAMQLDLDTNNNRIINLPAPVFPTEPVRQIDFDAFASSFTLEGSPIEALVFGSIIDLKAGTTLTGVSIDFAELASKKSPVQTQAYYSDWSLTSNFPEGGAEYVILTAADYTGTPDGFIDHFVGGGTDFVAAVKPLEKFDIKVAGAKGDGSDCTEQGQAVVDYLGGIGGGVLLFTEGEYDFTAAIRITDSFVSVEGLGSSSYLNPKSLGKSLHPSPGSGFLLYIMFTVGGGDPVADPIGLLGCSFKNLRISQNAFKSIPAGDFGFCRMFVIFNAQDFEISGIVAEHMGHFQTTQFCQNFSIKNNRLTLVTPDNTTVYGDACLASWDESSEFTYSNNVMIGRDPFNNLRGLDQGGTSISGSATDPGVGKTNNYTILDNIIIDYGRFGVWMDGRSTFNSQVIISNNLIRDCGEYGIRLDDVNTFNVQGNNLFKNEFGMTFREGSGTNKGTGCTDGLVEGNRITHETVNAITVQHESKQIIIRNNKIKPSSGGSLALGIKLKSDTVDCLVEDNYMTGYTDNVVDESANNNFALPGNNYTPTLGLFQNLDSATLLGPVNVSSSNGIVTLTGRASYVATSAGFNCQISVPVETAIVVGVVEVSGTVSGNLDDGLIKGHSSSKVVVVQFNPPTTTGEVSFTAQYRMY